MTPEEIFSSYGVDVTTLSTPYSSYHIATFEDLWLNTVTPKLEIRVIPETRVGDLIIITPDNYRSRIYSSKIPSRHVNLTGPDVYFYIYHRAYLIGTLKECATKYLNDWAGLNQKGTMTFSFDYDRHTVHIYISESIAAVRDELNGDYQITTMDFVLSKWGNRFVVQNFLDNNTPDLISCCFVGD
jgi:hypothetical protein